MNNDNDMQAGDPNPYIIGEQFVNTRGSTEKKIEQLEARIKELEGESASPRSSEALFKDVVILVHGIRDRALWQSEVRAGLKAAGFDVVLTNYERFDLFRFLFPIQYFRNAVVENIKNQIRTVKLQNPDRDISIIAHSFGSYVVSRVMYQEFDIIFKHVIFCGGVYSSKIRFEQFSNRFLPPILNEVGTKDGWPALANSLTWGYGSPGTFGFRRPLFVDRWHKNAGHNFFLTKEFCLAFWVPFLKTGAVIGGEESPDQPHWFVDLISWIHLKYVLLSIVLACICVYASEIREKSLIYRVFMSLFS